MLAARRAIAAMRGMSADLVRYFIAVALVGFAVDGGVYAVLLNLFLARLDYGPEQIGTINAVGTLTFAAASLPAGILGGRWGSRRVMVWGLALLAAGATLLPAADLLPAAAQLPWLLGTAVVLYLGLSLYFVNTAPLLLGLVPAEQRNQAYASQTALLSLASFLGSLAGGLLPPLFSGLLGASLADAGPYRYGLLAAGLATLPAIFAVGRTRAEPVGEGPAAPGGAGIAAPIIGLLSLIALVRTLQVAGLAATSTFFNLYLDQGLMVPTAQIGMLVALGRIIAVPAALSTARLTRRFGNRPVVIAASLATAVGMLPIALIPSWGAAGLSFMLVVSLSWIRYAASIVYFLDLVPARQRALVAGVTEMASGICFTLITFGGGYLIAFAGYQALFLLGAALTALSALAFWALFRGRQAAPAEAA